MIQLPGVEWRLLWWLGWLWWLMFLLLLLLLLLLVLEAVLSGACMSTACECDARQQTN